MNVALSAGSVYFWVVNPITNASHGLQAFLLKFVVFLLQCRKARSREIIRANRGGGANARI